MPQRLTCKCAVGEFVLCLRVHQVLSRTVEQYIEHRSAVQRDRSEDPSRL